MFKLAQRENAAAQMNEIQIEELWDSLLAAAISADERSEINEIFSRAS